MQSCLEVECAELVLSVATGAVGRQLLIELLRSDKWGKIVTITRLSSLCFVILRRDYDVPEVDIKQETESGRLEKRVCVLSHRRYRLWILKI